MRTAKRGRPAGAEATVRERLHRALLAGPCTVRDLSRAVGIPEHDVAAHLAHLDRSLRARRSRLVIEPASCLVCGFVFARRERLTRPSGCPSCGGRRISLPRFSVVTVSGAAPEGA